MSNRAITWAKSIKTGSPTLKALLLCLADYADENNSCFPGQALLAEETEQSIRTVRRQLADLETRGIIRREHRTGVGGHRTSDRFTLQIPTGQSVRKDSQPAKSDVPTGHQRSSQADTAMAEEPLVEPLEEKEVEPVGPTPIKAKNDRPELHNLCAHLANRMIENGCKPPTITDAWLTSARLMIDTDGREVAAIHKCIDWCQDNEFWRGNILSMPKLRAKYDQLRLAALKEQAQQQHAKKPILSVVRDTSKIEVDGADLPWNDLAGGQS